MGNMWIFSVFPKYTSPAGINPKKYLEVTFIHRNKNIFRILLDERVDSFCLLSVNHGPDFHFDVPQKPGGSVMCLVNRVGRRGPGG